MAKGKVVSFTKIVDNKKGTVVVGSMVEPVVVNGNLVADNNHVNPGVFSV